MKKKDITSIAIGRFDGLHLGHFKIFNNLDKNGGVVVIEDSRDKLTPIREEHLPLPFFYYHLKDIKNLSGRDFIELIKKDFPNLKKIVIGYDFKFGKDRAYSASDLKTMFSGEICIVDEFKLKDAGVHSRNIREFLKIGDIKMANNFLGRQYKISGRNIKGQGIGKKELFATLNIEINGYILPRNGVWASYTRVNKQQFKSVTFIGNRVSTDGKFSVETHILDENLDVRELSKVDIFFVKYIRENLKFNSLLDLKTQIQKDINIAREILNER
ncbi:bifunctional riboflavin kinase / FMN adenylyltransferase [Campylobacter blaseri]|uniref:Riboflavin biosynthesis protein n=1 Tax=Campylobacter blaseri TaxID=2042961 RepID=A0A2P8R234_9BACT|nr:bifunctional riboflavin kinase/FAD synthetase [Campylobacter blaseri]PSM52551.1 riboflavin biosynthesis protein RibF [Campylobacter blaseri]PSM54199.1 riboflavin biosynthesis protein RibF [Campylobacter blaseri]QKF85850.1 bifunctional riboflavin kinase / FMN adenylyltransferase [Campylobacter blaseri]